jgi:hypothetical protein
MGQLAACESCGERLHYKKELAAFYTFGVVDVATMLAFYARRHAK